MVGKLTRIGLILAIGMLFAMSMGRAWAEDTVPMNVFERFRYEMAIDRDAAAVKFMAPSALTKWLKTIAPNFDRKHGQIRHFFGLSMQLPKGQGADLHMIYFNPWVDGVMLTRWQLAGEDWKIVDFYLASGERLRGELTPQSAVTSQAVVPNWLGRRGVLLHNLGAYYKQMRALLLKSDISRLEAWFALDRAAGEADLLRVKLRMGLRSNMSGKYKSHAPTARILKAAFGKLVNDALGRNSAELARYSPQADILMDLRPEILKTLKANWIFSKGSVYSVFLGSAVMPRLYVFMNIDSSGRIETALYGDLEAMATYGEAAAAPEGRAAEPNRKVKRYTDAKGNKIEIITEKRDGKVTMTTRVNGKVTEVVNF